MFVEQALASPGLLNTPNGQKAVTPGLAVMVVVKSVSELVDTIENVLLAACGKLEAASPPGAVEAGAPGRPARGRRSGW